MLNNFVNVEGLNFMNKFMNRKYKKKWVYVLKVEEKKEKQ